jgi:hypothetical protein
VLNVYKKKERSQKMLSLKSAQKQLMPKNLTLRKVGLVIGACLSVYGVYCLLFKSDTVCPASTVYTPTTVESRVVEKTTFTTDTHRPGMKSDTSSTVSTQLV